MRGARNSICRPPSPRATTPPASMRAPRGYRKACHKGSRGANGYLATPLVGQSQTETQPPLVIAPQLGQGATSRKHALW